MLMFLSFKFIFHDFDIFVRSRDKAVYFLEVSSGRDCFVVFIAWIFKFPLIIQYFEHIFEIFTLQSTEISPIFRDDSSKPQHTSPHIPFRH